MKNKAKLESLIRKNISKKIGSKIRKEKMEVIKGSSFSRQWPTKMAHKRNHFEALLSISSQ